MIAAIVSLMLAGAQADEWAEFRSQPTKNAFQHLVPAKEAIGPGPHTLVISDRQGMTRIDYPTGPRCIKARDAIRKQTAPPPNTATVIYGPSSVKAFCVPR